MTLDVQTKESTDDDFTVVLCKIGLEESSRGNINGNIYKEQVLEVGYLENSDFIILYQM